MIHLNIGSNLESKHGSRYNNITIAINLLKDSKIKIHKISSFYETPSYPNQNFPKFLNVGIIANFNDNYIELLKITNLIEKKIGRIKSKKNDPRVIDIDIIDFKGIIKDSIDLILPHPKSHHRNFVLLPLFEINKNWVHPKSKDHIKTLILKLSNKDITCIKQI